MPASMAFRDGQKPKVIVSRRLPRAVETRMMELFEARLNTSDTPFEAHVMRAALADCDVLVPTVTDRLDAATIEAAGPSLRLIANFGTGVDHIDLEAAERRGVMVTNTPGVLTDDTADFTMALILASMRRLGEGERLLRAGRWEGWKPTGLLGSRLGGKRLGIVGMGRIGRALAMRARAFGMTIHYHNRHRADPELERELEATWWESLDQMLAHMDVISVNCPRTPATFHLLSARRLALMKPTAVLINAARGDIVDEAALIDLLERGAIAGAGLDVFEGEPDLRAAFLGLDNVVLTPHLGSATREARVAMGEKVIVNIRAFADGHAPPDRILRSLF